MRKLKKKKAIQIAKRYLFYCTLNYAFFISDAGQTAHYGIEPKKLSRRELAGIMHGFVNESYGTTAQFVGSAGDAFSAICCLQIFRFTSSKPSKSAIASDEKFIRLRTNSFVRYCLRKRQDAPQIWKSYKETQKNPPLLERRMMHLRRDSNPCFRLERAAS